MSGCIAGCQYIPSIEYFAHWLHHGTLVIEAHEHYQKRTWRNKTAILGPEKPLIMSVPLKKGKHHQMPITEVEVSYDESWHRVHFNGIQTAYGKSAFYGEIESDLQNIFSSTPLKLWDLNFAFIRLFISLIPGSWLFELTSHHEAKPTSGVIDLRGGVPAGFTSIPNQRIPVYQQVQRLKKPHFPNLSILDVLCHLGPGTRDYLIRYASQL